MLIESPSRCNDPVPSAWGLSRLAAGNLFVVDAYDGVTLVATPAVLSAIATVSGFLPASRASRIDPIRALRHE